jgi:hypothetical protein
MKNQPLDNPLEPRLPQSPLDISETDFPEVEPPKRKPKDGDQVPNEPKIKAGVIAPNIGKEVDDTVNNDHRWKTPLKPGVRGKALGARFARLSGAAQQRQENIALAIADGFSAAHARDMETTELSQDAEHLISLGFGGRSTR